MGGYGSGRWYRCGKKTTTQDAKDVDIRWMRRQGMLDRSGFGTISWSTGDRPNGRVQFEVRDDRLILGYRYQSGKEPWQDISQAIRFDRTPCNYGGERLLD